ncbi:MAG: hypothetical protein AABZ42_06010, partial [Thermoproteota archaeon]
MSSSTGTLFIACGNGSVYSQSSPASAWTSLGRPVTALTRYLPVLTFDTQGNLYASSFGGRYNTRPAGNLTWTGEKILTGLTSAAKGFVRAAGASNFAYAVWEEGNSNPVTDQPTATFDIVFARLNFTG